MIDQRDPRFVAFLSREAPDVFRSVLSTSDVWRPDPLDVPEIHATARRTFEEVIESTRARTAGPYDRLILLQGVAGSGKTHLISALRNELHDARRGFFTYMQMQTSIPDYGKYVLWNVIASLEKPFRINYSNESSFEAISRAAFEKAVAAGIVSIPSDDEEIFDPYDLAEDLKRRGIFSVDTQILAAVLQYQRHDVAEAEIVRRYLRCERLSPRDARRVDYLESRDNPIETLQQLALLIDETFGVPMVICVDQLDNFYSNEEEGGKRFREATATFDAIINGEHAETIVMLVSILDDQYAFLRSRLLQPQIDRYELGTPPIKLAGNVDAAQITAVLERRLSYLYERTGSAALPSSPLFPYASDTPGKLAGSRLRTALRILGEARAQSIISGLPPHIASGNNAPEGVPQGELVLSELWNDASLQSSASIPTDRKTLIELLQYGISAIAPELPPGYRAELVTDSDPAILDRATGAVHTRELLSITNEPAAFGNLGRAVEKLANVAHDRQIPAVIVRSADFPSSPKAKITEQLGGFLKAGNRRLTFAPGDWRTIAAYRTFTEAHRTRPDFEAWILEAKPLTSVPGMQALLELQDAVSAAPAGIGAVEAAGAEEETTAEVFASPPPQTVIAAPPNGHVPNGATASQPDRPVDPSTIELGKGEHGALAQIDLLSLTRHTAIFGGAGSGKTTLAFSLIEQLLDRGIPAILVDRKGDLCWLGDPEAWRREVDEPTALRRKALLSKLAIDVYTPGAGAGRNLAIDPLPSGLRDASPDERDEAARSASLALGEMLGYRAARNDRLAVLDRAIATLSALQDTMTLESLIEFIASEDPLLVAAIGRLNTRVLNAVANDLSVLKINAKRVLSPEAEKLDIEKLLGLGQYRKGKTQLSIISTKSLGEGVDALFWITRLLVQIARFTSLNPQPRLQAIVFLDEADQYLPATRRPITKEPMENLLRRARSGGFGVVLATQSPGDFDYKCKDNITTWLVGRVTQNTALTKLESVLGNKKVLERLAQLKAGEFYLKNEPNVTAFKANLPLVIPTQLDESRILDLAGKRWARPAIR